MEQLTRLLEGFSNTLTSMNLLWVLIGAIPGTAVGVPPGLGSSVLVTPSWSSVCSSARSSTSATAATDRVETEETTTV